MVKLVLRRHKRHRYHTGFLYIKPDEINKVKHLHLSDHHKILNEDFTFHDRKNQVIDIPLHPVVQNNLRAMCIRVAQKIEKNEVPYTFTTGNGYFNKNGIWVSNKPEEGLTCATFIMAIYKSIKIPLVDINTWKKRKSDIKWQKEIIEYFKKENNKHKELIVHLERSIGAYRYRPEEVAAAANLKNPPIKFEKAKEHTKTLNQYYLCRKQK